ncbi:MAG: DUF2853 family protein [Saprospiraceae bacterium]|jgi:hypothetical protein|nr:DUF2853 family protein [Saprospiraceae bacterium]
MSQFDEKMAIYKEAVADLKLHISDELLTGVAKGLGPSIYLADASLVSGSDPEELARVKKNFLVGKLGLTDGPELDKAIQSAIDAMGSSNRNKHRAVFYAILAKHFGKESMFK